MSEYYPNKNHYIKKSSKMRSQRGIGIIMLGSIFSLIVMPLLAVLTFEIARLYLAKEQLQNATDAAVLTATATLASSNNTDPTTAHNNAMQAALAVFQQNSVLAGQLSSSSIVPALNDLDCLSGESKLYFEFLDPVTKNVVPISSPNGKVINLYTCAGAYLAFGKYLGISSLQVTATSKGAVPILDIELCFDVSGSMDDQAPVTFALRRWDPTLTPTGGPPRTGALTYDIPTGAQGTIASILQPPPIGTSLNGVFPQGFDATELAGNGQNLTFTGEAGSNMRSLGGWTPNANGIGGDAGQPPGNYPSGTNPFAGHNTYYTDVVVNIDGNTIFGGTTSGGYNFPDLATLVEASRGNLENVGVFTASKANTSVPSTVTPKAGYQAAYFAAATPVLQPIGASQAAALTFADILNTDTDCHFGMVAFDDGIGTASNPSVTISGGIPYEDFYNLDGSNTPYGQQVLTSYPLPLIPLNPALAATNYPQVVSAIQSTVAMGGTNIGAAIDQAVQDLQTNGRQGSVRAIVLFTDGEPTLGGPLDANPATNARMAAAEAAAAGIPVYTIGLAQTAAIEPSETAILNDTDPNPNSGGIAAIAGHGGAFNLVTNSAQLEVTFEKIARRLVELVANAHGDY